MKKFAIFGNPVKHSKSPFIHQLFSKQTGIALDYDMILTPIDNFQQNIKSFFACKEAIGANITTPFKEQAYHYADELTQRALLAGAVNTLKILKNGCLLGDNTDGIGLLSDMQRLNMISSKTKVLLLGSGGAARGIIEPLLSIKCNLTITNRTYSRAQELVRIFSYLGNITSITFDQLQDKKFDLIINATSSGIHGIVPEIPSEIINKHTSCYDLFYQTTLTPFLSWAQNKGAQQLADGSGMLVEQAAHSFLLWHGIMPERLSVLQKIRE
ncbi:Shikimate dehydrogenase (NADP(+)) [Candidatus Profftia lariciata]|uniref:shikimate dehydrogenase n=1 Tax=Candidatus Profftia lariciata TaxID=1987921 RepID=UPI001D003AC3|nr:shikimate dehydrogenase [Candidatus Profftia lariciata]UDG81415.1 Shikimate dehydrogenase (NADP(+)) [Candidatus Profftia lariciata]